jgi:hypothetical protein
MADEQVGKILSGRIKKVSRKRRYPWTNPTELQKAIFDCIAVDPLGVDFHIPPDRPYYRGKKAIEREALAREVINALTFVNTRDVVRKARLVVKYDPFFKDVFDENIQV